MFTVYILYSETLDGFYVGRTSIGIEERMRRHLSNHSGYTGKAKDWQLVWKYRTEELSISTRLEKKIKSRGAKRYLQDRSG